MFGTSHRTQKSGPPALKLTQASKGRITTPLGEVSAYCDDDGEGAAYSTFRYGEQVEFLYPAMGAASSASVVAKGTASIDSILLEELT